MMRQNIFRLLAVRTRYRVFTRCAYREYSSCIRYGTRRRRHRPMPPDKPATCLTIVQKTLEQAGAKLEDVVRTRMYLTHVEDWEADWSRPWRVLWHDLPGCYDGCRSQTAEPCLAHRNRSGSDSFQRRKISERPRCHKLSIRDLSLEHKHVLIRVDFNVPLSEDGTLDHGRYAHPRDIPNAGICTAPSRQSDSASHLGRPKGKPNRK